MDLNEVVIAILSGVAGYCLALLRHDLRAGWRQIRTMALIARLSLRHGLPEQIQIGRWLLRRRSTGSQ